MRFEAKAWQDINDDGAVSPDEVDGDGCDDACTVCDDTCLSSWEDGSRIPVAVPSGIPWRNATQVHAYAMCRSLGPGFDLMANREWMTVARDAELQGANWSGGAPGAGRLVEGNTDGSEVLSVSDPNDEYSDTGNSAADAPGAGWEQRRTLHLGNGTVLWDLPGSMQEWVDWTLGPPLDGPPSPCAGAELNAFTCAGYVYDDFNSTTGTYDSQQGVGWVLGGSGNAARRGGQHTDRVLGYAGIYALNMNRFTGDTFPATGFRCVYRP